MNKLNKKYFLYLFALVIALTGFFSSSLWAQEDLSEANLKSFDVESFPAEEPTDERPKEPTIDLSLYQTNVEVKGTSETARNQAFGELLQKILIKITANPKVIDLPTIKSALKQPENFVEQFSYTHNPSYQLNAHFNQVQVDALLKKAGQPIFNQKRPAVLVWLINQTTKGESHLVGSLSEDSLGQDWEKTLHADADNIGLTLILPFADLDDLTTISSKNLWDLTPKKLLEASERYGTQTVLVIKIDSAKTNPCITQWALRPDEDKHTINWKESANTCQAALESGAMATLHNLFPPQKKAKNSTDEKKALPLEVTKIIHISIFHIQSAEDYQLILNDLQNQPNVVDVEIEKVTPTEVSYQLRIKGNSDEITQNLSTHSALQLLKKNGNTLEYEFVGRPSTDIWEEER